MNGLIFSAIWANIIHRNENISMPASSFGNPYVYARFHEKHGCDIYVPFYPDTFCTVY